MINELTTLSLRAEDYDAPASWRLANWCRRHGAEEWTITQITVGGGDEEHFKVFDGQIEAYAIARAPRRHLTASHAQDFIRSLPLWKLNRTTFAALQSVMPEGLFTYDAGKDGWFEDPIFYRQGELMLGVITHEREGILRVTDKEAAFLRAEGFVFHAHGTYLGY